MSLSNKMIEDFFFLFKGLIILFLALTIGIVVSQYGVDSLTSKKDVSFLLSAELLSEGRYQIVVLGEKVQTPQPLLLGTIKNVEGQVWGSLGKKKFSFSTTLQMGKVDVLCKEIKENISPWKLRIWHFIHIFF